jgi:hypothetical protein
MSGDADNKRGHRSIEHGSWAWYSKSAHDRALSHPVYGGSHLLLVYIALTRIESDTQPKYKDGFFASAAGIAARCGLGKRTVERILPGIAAAGLAVVTSGRKSGDKTSAENGETTRAANRYTLTNFGEQTATQAECIPPTSHASQADNKRKAESLLKRKGRRRYGGGADAPAASVGSNESIQAPTSDDGGGSNDWHPLQ